MSNINYVVEKMNAQKMRNFVLTLKNKTFIHLNMFRLLEFPDNTSNYFLYKTRQPITGKLYVEEKIVELPMCKVYNFYSVGLFIGHILELPKHINIKISDNYIMAVKGKPPAKQAGSTMLYTNQYINIYGASDKMTLVCSNDPRYATLKR